MKTLLSASALALLLALPAAAQTTTTTTPTTSPSTTVRTDAKVEQPKVVQRADQIDTDRLAGRNVVNAQGDKIGEIESVLIGRDGKVQAVIVGVGGFLGMGEHHVALDWNELQILDNGQRVVSNMTKDQLKAMPEFRYASRDTGRDRADRTDRMAARDTAAPAVGAQVRADTRAATTDTRTTATATDRPATTAAVSTTATAKPLGQMRADELIGKDVVNARGDKVGDIEDIVIDNNKAVMAIVSVGGFLGMGDKDVAIPFDQLRMNDRNAILMSETSADQLKQLPAYKKTDAWRPVERNRPILER